MVVYVDGVRYRVDCEIRFPPTDDDVNDTGGYPTARSTRMCEAVTSASSSSAAPISRPSVRSQQRSTEPSARPPISGPTRPPTDTTHTRVLRIASVWRSRPTALVGPLGGAPDVADERGTRLHKPAYAVTNP